MIALVHVIAHNWDYDMKWKCRGEKSCLCFRTLFTDNHFCLHHNRKYDVLWIILFAINLDLGTSTANVYIGGYCKNDYSKF